MHTYSLFCETAKCRLITRNVEKSFDCIAIYPKLIQHTWSKGKMIDIEHDLLPGYVFVYCDRELLNIELVRSVQGVIRCLGTADGKYELTDRDEQFALMLLRNRGVIGKTKVYEEGQLIRICEGAFKGLETRILKVNRQKKRMQIEIPFASTLVKTWVEFEIVSDLKEEESEKNLLPKS